VIPESAVREFYTNGTDLAIRDLEEILRRAASETNLTAAPLVETKRRIESVREINLARLQEPEKVRVVHLFMSLRNRETGQAIPEPEKQAKLQKMADLLRRARAGEDFFALVQAASEDINLKQTKGEYTFSMADRFPEEFKAAAFTMQTNQISDIVATTFGCHLIKLLEKIPARKTEFDKAAEGIKDLLRAEEIEKRMPAYVARVKQEAAVTIRDPQYLLNPNAEQEMLPKEPK
jgi:hypothetical protein